MSDSSRCYRSLSPGEDLIMNQPFPKIPDINPYNKNHPLHSIYKKMRKKRTAKNSPKKKEKILSIRPINLPKKLKSFNKKKLNLSVDDSRFESSYFDSFNSTKSNEEEYHYRYERIKKHLNRMKKINQEDSKGSKLNLISVQGSQLAGDTLNTSQWRQKQANMDPPKVKMNIQFGDLMGKIQNENLLRVNFLVDRIKNRAQSLQGRTPKSITNMISNRSRRMKPRPLLKENYKRKTKASWNLEKKRERKIIRSNKKSKEQKIVENDLSIKLKGIIRASKSSLPEVEIQNPISKKRKYNMRGEKKNKPWRIVENSRSVEGSQNVKKTFKRYMMSKRRDILRDRNYVGMFRSQRPVISLKEIL